MQASVLELTSGVAPARAEAPEAPEAGPGVCGGGGGTGRGLGGGIPLPTRCPAGSCWASLRTVFYPRRRLVGVGGGGVCLPLIL